MAELIAEAVAGGIRRDALEALRGRLAAEIDGGGHQPGCGCECGPGAADGRVLASLTKELRAVLAELDGLPLGEKESKVADLSARIAARRVKPEAACL